MITPEDYAESIRKEVEADVVVSISEEETPKNFKVLHSFRDREEIRKLCEAEYYDSTKHIIAMQKLNPDEVEVFQVPQGAEIPAVGPNTIIQIRLKKI